MHYLILSFTHRNTTLPIRDKLAFNDDESKLSFLQRSVDSPFVNEAIVLSTCNRIEVITSCNNPTEASKHLYLLLNEHSGIALDELEGRAEQFEDQGGIHHLFSVASSLDSLIVGETQIAGQLKDAYRFALEHGFCADKLTRAVNYAFKCAAEVRNRTEISSKPVSVASVAVAAARRAFGSLEGKSALVIGSGEMSVIAARTLYNHGAEVSLMNRTMAKIEPLAEEVGGSLVPFNRLADVLGKYDMIFSATGSETPIIDGSMPFRRDEPCHWFDMAVPRDIDEVDHAMVKVYRIDDLKNTVDENIMLREEEAKASFAIVGRYTAEFYAWLKSLNIEPLIKAMYQRAEASAREESTRAIAKGFLPKTYEAQAQKMALQAIKRYLHPQVMQLRRAADVGDIDAIIESMAFILNMSEE
ncbi:MAG TPA: glutamyl-tRNA reductase [Chlorobaculum parvum]|uniref:Glutamyl-tRNA reductase n=1 Tax=Chlorobaculum parvum TaxID=274539 RepID=A0A7C5DBF2_9CHLB|nr:glutamyl-tRNA reductase [Chlorobaculum parvum]